eukprot:jgi/Ulvmu1/5291/UM022_0085.1
MLNDAGKVFVGGLSADVTQEEISEKFEKFGRIEKIWVARQPPGFAFVHFESSDEADEACAALNDVDGWRVEKARPRRPGGGYSRGGGYGSRGGGYDRDRYDRGGGGGGQDYRERYDRRDYGGDRSYDRGYDRGSYERGGGGGGGGGGGRERYGDRDSYRDRDYRS